MCGVPVLLDRADFVPCGTLERSARGEAGAPFSLSLFFGNARDSVRATCTFVTGTYHNVTSRHTGSKNSVGHNAPVTHRGMHGVRLARMPIASLKHRLYITESMETSIAETPKSQIEGTRDRAEAQRV